jgi:hypothetical protein
MINNSTTVDRCKVSAVTLGNAAELVAGVITEIAGNDIGNAIGGTRISMQLIRSLAMARFNRHIQDR